MPKTRAPSVIMLDHEGFTEILEGMAKARLIERIDEAGEHGYLMTEYGELIMIVMLNMVPPDKRLALLAQVANNPMPFFSHEPERMLKPRRTRRAPIEPARNGGSTRSLSRGDGPQDVRPARRQRKSD